MPFWHFMKFLMILVGIVFLFSSAAFAEVSGTNGLLTSPLSISGQSKRPSPCAPLELPMGFNQSIVVQELPNCITAKIILDAIPGINDWTDMMTVTETGEKVGRFLYRTHEADERRAAISVIDLETGQTAVHTGPEFGGWERLDGIEWTPWGSILVAEEAGAFGRLFECEVNGLDLSCVDRPAVGRMSHEGIAVTQTGELYLVDEFDGGSIFKFVPDEYGSLTSGRLFALHVLSDDVTVCSGKTGIGFTPTGPAEWVPLTPEQNQVVTDPTYTARAAAHEARATQFCRPEDIEIIGDNLYVATTTTHTVLQIPITTPTPVITEYAGINTNMNPEDVQQSYGLKNPDNLASDRFGNLYIVEDNNGKSDIWVATPDNNQDGLADTVVRFGTLRTYGAEASGIYIPPIGPPRIFLNVQHAYDGNDMTLMITPIKH